MAYELFRQSVQGAGHIKKGMPCEDYGIKFENENCKIFALGDGHGDANCPRSSYGSQSVCEIAVEELRSFAKAIKEQCWEERLMNKYEASGLVRQLIASIFGKWSCRVNDELAENPLTEKEETEAKDYIERYKRGERIEHIYGTTLIAGMLTDAYLLLLQQGDGRCVVFDCEGNASQPIPWDDRCFSNVTTSVCDTDAVQSCRYHIIDLRQNSIIACVAGSDGVEDSFGSMDRMYTYYREKLQIACESGVEELEKHWAETLPSFSAEGSQDDVTICGVIDCEAFKSKLEKIIADNEAVVISDAINKAQERIDSMAPKLAYLQKRCSEADATYTQLQQKYSKLEKEDKRIRSFLKSLEKIEAEKETLKIEVHAALDRRNSCINEYNNYKQKYESFVNLKLAYEAKAKGINLSEYHNASENESSRPSMENIGNTIVTEDEVTEISVVEEPVSEMANHNEREENRAQNIISDVLGQNDESAFDSTNDSLLYVVRKELSTEENVVMNESVDKDTSKFDDLSDNNNSSDNIDEVNPSIVEVTEELELAEKKSKWGLFAAFKKNTTE